MKTSCDHSESVLYCHRRTERSVRLPGDTILILNFVQSDTIRTDVRAFSLKIRGNEQPQEAFYATGITEVRIPASVTKVGKAAFDGCNKLTSVYLTQNIDIIERSAFNAQNLSNVYYGGSKYYWDRITVEDGNDKMLKATIVCNYVEESGGGNVGKPFIGDKKTSGETGENADVPTATKTNISGIVIAVLSAAVVIFAAIAAVVIVLLVKNKKKSGKAD